MQQASTDVDVALPIGQSRKLRGVERTIARRMVAAWSAPVFHLTAYADVTGLRDSLAGVQANVTDGLVLAAARALAAHPKLNAYFDDEIITELDDINVGLAVDSPNGLMVPVIRMAGAQHVRDVTALRKDVVGRARSGTLTMADMTGGTFTISNLGMFGIAHFDAILNPPQVAILAVGASSRELAMEAGQLVEREVVSLTLTCDHRALGGADGARFLQSLVANIESLVKESDD